MIRTPLSIILGALAAFAVISGSEAVLAAQSDGAKPSFEAYQAPTQHPLYLALCALLAEYLPPVLCVRAAPVG